MRRERTKENVVACVVFIPNSIIYKQRTDISINDENTEALKIINKNNVFVIITTVPQY